MVKETKQIWGTVKDCWIKKRFENPYVSHFICLLIIIYPTRRIFKKMHAWDAGGGAKLE